MSARSLPSRVARGLGWTLLALMVVLVLAVAAGWWWTGTQGSLDYVLRRFGEPAGVNAVNARGSLREGMTAEQLTWSQGGLSVQARGVDVAYDLRALLGRQLRVNHLRADEVSVTDRRPKTHEPSRPPESIALPLPVVVEDFSIGRVRHQGAEGEPLEVRAIAGRYAYDGAAHRLAVKNIEYGQGRAQGELQIGDRGELPLTAKLRGELRTAVPGREQPVSLRFDLSAEGPITQLNTAARLRAAPGTFPEDRQPAADLTAIVTPWGEAPVRSAEMQLQNLDLSTLSATAPRTRLAGRVEVKPTADKRLLLQADLDNAEPGPWDRRQLPLAQLAAEGEWQPGGPAQLRRFRADIGGGVIEGQGRWDGKLGWNADLNLRRIDPARIYSELASTPIGGTVSARGSADEVEGRVDLAATGATAATEATGATGATPAAPAAQAARPAPRRAAAGSQQDLRALMQALSLQRLSGSGRWSQGLLTVRDLDLRTRDAGLRADLRLRPKERSGEGRAQLQAPGLAATFDGSVAATRGGGTLQLKAPQLAQAAAWLQSLPGMPADLIPPLQGDANVDVKWQGGWENPEVHARLTAPRLRIVPAAGEPGGVPVDLLGTELTVDGNLARASFELQAQARRDRLSSRLDTRGEVAREDDSWRLRVDALQLAASGIDAVPGDWRLRLPAPLNAWRRADGGIDLAPGQLVLTPPRAEGRSDLQIAWEASRWRQGELSTAGTATGLSLAWVSLFTGRDVLGPALAGDLRFDAEWQLRMGDSLQLRAALQRRSGDLAVLAEGDNGQNLRLPAGIREARLTVENQGQQLRATIDFASERAGSIQGQAITQLVPGGPLGWEVLPTAPLGGRIEARLPRLSAWSLLAPPGWRVRGSLQAEVELGGVVSDPRFNGLVTAEDLAVRSLVEGIALQDGQLRARLQGQRVAIESLRFRGPGPAAEAGTLTATGFAERGPQGLQMEIQARLDRLRASVRSDRQATVSGTAQARLGPGGTEVTGDLRVDRALIVLPEESAPSLGDDVVVTNLPDGVTLRPEKAARSGGSGTSLRLDVGIDLGNDFRVRGRGINATMRGAVRVAGTDLGDPRVQGEVRLANGEFAAYGQRLDIERGILRFTGPATNPSLDILAVRPRLQPKVGVQVTGSAQAPDIRLYSETAMSEAEKLSMLVLGRSSASGGAEAALLQRAALALLSSRGGAGSGGGIASRFGLDELSVKRDGDEGAALTLGKRFSDRLYASVERGLSGALGTLYVFYDITNRLTLRGQAGERAAVDLIYRFSYD